MNKNPGMKWHGFIIHFSVWPAAIADMLLGVGALSIMNHTPGRYIGQRHMILAAAVIGAALILCGVYLIAARFLLAGFRSGAPNHLFAAQTLSVIAVTMFLVLDVGPDFAVCASAVLIAIITRLYYGKRNMLFTN